jgi:hypothetical protein
MAIDPLSAQGQAQVIYKQLGQYFTDMNTYLLNGGSCPDFSTYITTLDYSALGVMTDQLQGSSANYANGATIESAHHIMAVLREYGIRTKNKASYYQDATGESSTESQYYGALGTAMTSTIGGVVVPGGSL